MQPTTQNTIAKFCTSMRKRPELAPVIPILLNSVGLKWRESRLTSIDLVVPRLGTSKPDEDVLSFILLSSADLGKPEVEQRLDRLSYLNGGRDVAVIFLLSKTPTGTMSSREFQQLQCDMLGKFDLPILPLITLSDLPDIVAAFRGMSAAPSQLQRRAPPPVTRTLLPYCSTGPALAEHATNLLSDISCGFGDLADKVMTEDGRALIRDYLGEWDGEMAISFWMDEYTKE